MRRACVNAVCVGGCCVRVRACCGHGCVLCMCVLAVRVLCMCSAVYVPLPHLRQDKAAGGIRAAACMHGVCCQGSATDFACVAVSTASSLPIYSRLTGTIKFRCRQRHAAQLAGCVSEQVVGSCNALWILQVACEVCSVLQLTSHPIPVVQHARRVLNAPDRSWCLLLLARIAQQLGAILRGPQRQYALLRWPARVVARQSSSVRCDLSRESAFSHYLRCGAHCWS